MVGGQRVEWRDDQFPPRGAGVGGRAERMPAAHWGHPWQLGPGWDWAPGKILLGLWDRRKIGRADNRHVVTVAGSRAGKSSTVLVHNLKRWPGSALVLDPKGELAEATALVRKEVLGQDVYILDPFGETSASLAPYRANHNPFEELGGLSEREASADAAQLADAMIVGNEKDPYWTDAAKNLIRGFTLHLLSTGSTATIRELRDMLGSDGDELEELLREMRNNKAFEGAIRNVGASFLGKALTTPKELQSILSTAQEQTTPLDDLRDLTDRSDFRLRELKQRPMTIYVVLPGTRMGTHFRWLRVVIQQALAAMEREKTGPEHPVLFMLEEFPVLGYMRAIETAAGFMAGFGVKLWTVVQDFTQLKTNYPNSWETFLGNAGIIQAFGNVDLTTTEYLSKRLGHSIVIETQDIPVNASAMGGGDLGRREHVRHVSLLEAPEITRFFSRDSNRQLVLIPELPPIYMNRLPRARMKAARRKYRRAAPD
jgi:type IV secretion system protein VirD4